MTASGVALKLTVLQAIKPYIYTAYFSPLIFAIFYSVVKIFDYGGILGKAQLRG
jgi:hypothetical protein